MEGRGDGKLDYVLSDMEESFAYIVCKDVKNESLMKYVNFARR